MEWLPNPYTIAQQLTNRADLDPLFKGGGKEADAFLLKAFLSGRRQKTITGALGVFERITTVFERATTLSQAMDESKQIWAEEGYTAEEIERVLPDLVQLARPPSNDEFANADDLIVEKVSYLDPVQGSVADCYLISAMIALAWAEGTKLTARLNSAGFTPRRGSFKWRFHDREGKKKSQISVSGRIMLFRNRPRYARSSMPAEDWPSLVEKAYVVHVCGANVAKGEPSRPNYKSIAAMNDGSKPAVACRSLLGGRRRGALLNSEIGRRIFLEGGKLESPSGVMTKPVMASTNSVERMQHPNTKDGTDLDESKRDVWKETGLWPRHAYAVLGTMLSNNTVKHVVLRNPHGAPTDPERRLGYHPGPWNPDGRPPVPLNKNGVFAISRELFYTNFKHIGWVDL